MAEWTLSSFHKPNHRPDRCAETVSDRHGFWHSSQCSRKRGHGPEQAFCKQHSPEAKAEREAKWQEKYDAERKAYRRERLINEAKSSALDACRQIAAGHNDPRELAQAVIDMLPE